MNRRPHPPAPTLQRSNWRCLCALPVVLPVLCAAAPLPRATLVEMGEDALAADLPEIAARHFAAGLAAEPDAANTAGIQLLLAEALVRGGDPGEALKILSNRDLKDLPDAVLWKGFALATLGRDEEAIAALSSPAAADQPQAILAAAKLLLADGRTGEALRLVSSPAATDNKRPNDPLLLLRASILIEQGRREEARTLLPPNPDPTSPGIPPEQRLLHARLLLQEGDPRTAIKVLDSLMDPRSTPGPVLHRAAVEMTDALLAAEETGKAEEFLTGFIDSHPQSPQLDALFARVHTMLAARPDSEALLAKLTFWSASENDTPPGPVAEGDSEAASALPRASATDRRPALALLAKARALLATNRASASAEARLLLAKLISLYPEAGLADEALLLFARDPLSAGSPLSPPEIAAILDERGAPRELVGQAEFLAGLHAYRQGGNDQAASAFNNAAELLAGGAAATARTNAALALLVSTSGPREAPETDAGAVARETIASLESPDLALKVAEALPDPGERRAALEAFLANHPRHPRAVDARIAAAEAALEVPKPDLSFARAQLETIEATPGDDPQNAESPRAQQIRMRIDDIAGNAEAAVAGARDFLKRFPQDPASADVLLLLARNLSASGDFNEARLIFEQLASSEANRNTSHAYWLMAARSASRVPTPQSRQEALGLYDKAISATGPVAALARLEKARLLIDANQLDDAEKLLGPWRASLKQGDPLRIPTGFLLAECHQARGPADRKSAAKALSVLDELLEESGDDTALHNRIQYLRGKVLEESPASDGSPRLEEALATFYSVLETRTPPPEWHYFELCGFRALTLLEKAGRWTAAARCADRIASFEGPRAQEASARADRIRLEQMIWED